MQKYIHIGKLVATHGVGGELILVHSLGNRQAFKNVKALYVEEGKASYIPYFIKKATPKKEDEALLQLEDVASKEQAQRFIKKNVWLTEADFAATVDKNAAISLLNYAVYNRSALLGNVEEVIEQPHQLLLKTHYKNKEVLLPLHDATLLKIDRNKKEILLQLPDGLLEIYMEN